MAPWVADLRRWLREACRAAQGWFSGLPVPPDAELVNLDEELIERTVDNDDDVLTTAVPLMH